MTTPSFTLTDVTLPSSGQPDDDDQPVSLRQDDEIIPSSPTQEPNSLPSIDDGRAGSEGSGTGSPEGSKPSSPSLPSELEEQPSTVLPRRSKRTRKKPDFLQVGLPDKPGKVVKRKPLKKQPRKKPSSVR